MEEIGKSANFKKGSGGNIEHNNRTEKRERDNIDETRKEQNITLVNIPIKEFYEQTFGDAVEEYNSKQKRADRKIVSYYDKIAADEKKNLFYEIIIQIGDMYDTNCKDNPQKEIDLLKEYAKEFEVRNPTFKVFNAVIHLDEETPHLHIDYVPVAKNLTRGLSIQNSQTKALEQNENIVEAKKQFIEEEMKKGKKANPLIDQFFLKQERNHISELMEKYKIKQKDKEQFKRGDLSVAQYKVAAKIGTSLSQKFIDNINKKNLDMDFKKVLGKKIITDDQIEEINNKLSLKEFEMDKLKLKVEELISGIEKANADKEKFMRNNLSKKYVTQDILIKELAKELDKVNAELQIIKNTPNAELENAKKKIKELELAARQKKEQEELKAKEYENKKLDRLKQKEFQDNKNIRLEKYDTHFIDMIKTNATELFEIGFEDFTKGSYLKKNDFEDLVDNVVNKLKEMYKDFADLFNYKNLNGVECNLIEEEVDIVAEQYEEYKQKTTSRERQ